MNQHQLHVETRTPTYMIWSEQPGTGRSLRALIRYLGTFSKWRQGQRRVMLMGFPGRKGGGEKKISAGSQDHSPCRGGCCTLGAPSHSRILWPAGQTLGERRGRRGFPAQVLTHTLDHRGSPREQGGILSRRMGVGPLLPPEGAISRPVNLDGTSEDYSRDCHPCLLPGSKPS